MKTPLAILCLLLTGCMTAGEKKELQEWRYIKSVLAMPAGPPIHVETK